MKLSPESEANLKSMRFKEPDMLKGLAVVLMIQVHITELLATPEFYDSLAGNISLFLGGVPAAPVFMVMMGFFAARAGGTRKGRIYRAFKLLVWGFLLNAGLNMHLLLKILLGTVRADPLAYLFGVDILYLAGLSLLLAELVRPLFKENAFVWLAAALFAAWGSTVIPPYSGESSVLNYVSAFCCGKQWWSYFPLFPWLAYPFAGIAGYHLLNMHAFDLSGKRNRCCIAVVSALVVIFAFPFGFRVSAYLPGYYHHGAGFFLWALSFVVLITVLASFIPRHWYNFFLLRSLVFAGRKVTSFYVFQWLIIGNVSTAFYRSQKAEILPLWFLGVTILSWILVLLWDYRKSLAAPPEFR